jgi:hypothetical protein
MVLESQAPRGVNRFAAPVRFIVLRIRQAEAFRRRLRIRSRQAATAADDHVELARKTVGPVTPAQEHVGLLRPAVVATDFLKFPVRLIHLFLAKKRLHSSRAKRPLQAGLKGTEKG